MLLRNTLMPKLHKFSELSPDDLYIRYAAMHIVTLPITVSAAWRATNTYNSLKNPIHFICTTSHSNIFLLHNGRIITCPLFLCNKKFFHDNLTALHWAIELIMKFIRMDLAELLNNQKNIIYCIFTNINSRK
jgi:hypothetical protein